MKSSQEILKAKKKLLNSKFKLRQGILRIFLKQKKDTEFKLRQDIFCEDS